MRKLYLIAGLYAACVIGAVLSGCSIYDKEDLSKMVATPGDAECQADGAKNGEGDAEGKENMPSLSWRRYFVLDNERCYCQRFRCWWKNAYFL